MSAAKLFMTLDGKHHQAYLAYSVEMLVRTVRYALESDFCKDADEIEARARGAAEALAIAEAMACALHEAVAGQGASGR